MSYFKLIGELFETKEPDSLMQFLCMEVNNFLKFVFKLFFQLNIS